MMFTSVLASNQGGRGGFFTALSSGCEFLPAQTIRFFPPLFNETLDASRKEGFFFYEPIPQPFDG